MQRSPRNVPATQRSATSTTIAVATFHHCHVHPTIDHVRYYHVPPRDAHRATPTTQRPATSTPRPLQRSQLPHVHHCNVVACYFSTCNATNTPYHHGHHGHHGHHAIIHVLSGQPPTPKLFQHQNIRCVTVCSFVIHFFRRSSFIKHNVRNGPNGRRAVHRQKS